MYMWRALRRTLEHGEVPLLDADFLAKLSHDDFDRVFADDLGTNPLSVAAGERIANLRDLGLRLSAAWDGQFLNVARASEGSLVEFSRSSQEFRAFDDPVHKLTMVNAILHSGSGVFEFLDQPLPAIDYHLLKHALRQGMVRATGELEQKLRAGELLTSAEGQGLRTVALGRLRGACRSARDSGEIIDNKYWLNRSNCAEHSARVRRPGNSPPLPVPGGVSAAHNVRPAARAHAVLLALEDREDIEVGFRLERAHEAHAVLATSVDQVVGEDAGFVFAPTRDVEMEEGALCSVHRYAVRDPGDPAILRGCFDDLERLAVVEVGGEPFPVLVAFSGRASEPGYFGTGGSDCCWNLGTSWS